MLSFFRNFPYFLSFEMLTESFFVISSYYLLTSVESVVIFPFLFLVLLICSFILFLFLSHLSCWIFINFSGLPKNQFLALLTFLIFLFQYFKMFIFTLVFNVSILLLFWGEDFITIIFKASLNRCLNH